MKTGRFTSRWRLLLAVPVGLISGACSPVDAGAETRAVPASVETSEPQRHPVSGLEIIDVTVETGERKLVFKTELAASIEAQTKGLMFRNALGDDEAMLFPSPVPQPRSFWMRNTPISLDIIFVGTDGRITNIAERTEPYSLESLPSKGLASAVLEIRGGLSEELGIEPGDAVEYQLPE